ncbi:hypothetical protein D3Z45_00430 [Lachnospiraceae bacterium]|nr:hypothetical protein [Lachnospiraceae bacterium]
MKRKCILATGIMVMLMAFGGCGTAQDAGDGSAQIPIDEAAEKDTGQQGLSEAGETDVSPIPEPDAPQESSVEKTEEAMIIGGKVRDVMEDSFVISRVQYMDSDNTMVLIPEEGSPEEELVTVRCTGSTVFEHWLIQGGGAGIDMREATFADIQEGGGLEAEGYFDGEEFMASKVIIETYE